MCTQQRRPLAAHRPRLRAAVRGSVRWCERPRPPISTRLIARIVARLRLPAPSCWGRALLFLASSAHALLPPVFLLHVPSLPRFLFLTPTHLLRDFHHHGLVHAKPVPTRMVGGGHGLPIRRILPLWSLVQALFVLESERDRHRGRDRQTDGDRLLADRHRGRHVRT